METEQLDQRLVSVVPSSRQLAHQQMEFYGFVHFTVNTYTEKEWGDGTEPDQRHGEDCAGKPAVG